jgi:hypothetical protein
VESKVVMGSLRIIRVSCPRARLLTCRPIQIALRVLLVAFPSTLLGLLLLGGDNKHRRRRHYDRRGRS